MTTAIVKMPEKNDSHALAPAEPVARGLMRPIARPADVLDALKETREMLAKTLVDGDDYGAIPGTDKKVLLKPGAEKVAFSFGVRPEYEVVQADIDHERVMRFKSPWVEAPDPGKAAKEKLKAEGKGRSRKVDGEWQWQVPGDGFEETTGLYRYVIRCKLVRFDGVVVGEGVGSCSSLESKYRSRPHDVENTVLKMAEKRAFVAAVLTSFGLSGAFTQDLEDTQDTTPTPAPQPRPSVQPKQASPLDIVKKAAWVELDRLQVGAGMNKDDMKTARLNCVKRLNDGVAPETLEDWNKVLDLLKEEPDPVPLDDAPADAG